MRIEVLDIPAANGLDAIEVHWRDLAPGEGSVAIICWGAAWSGYWRAMGSRTIRQFFSDADVDYLVTKMGITPLLKQRKADFVYLGRIVRAIKAAQDPDGGRECHANEE